MASLALLLLALLAGLSCATAYNFLDVTFFPPNSKCNATAPSPAAKQTYTLRKCYGGVMYDCQGSSVSYMLFGDVNCVSKYPNSYGLPAEFCMSPVYAYSKYDSFMHCYN